MRRAIAEWGLVVSLLIALATALIWVDALIWRALEEPLAVIPGVYLSVRENRLCLFTELGGDWKPHPWKTANEAHSWVRHYTTYFFPGIEYHHRFYVSGQTVWSVEISPAIPLIISLFLMAIFWRLGRGRSRGRGSAATR